MPHMACLLTQDHIARAPLPAKNESMAGMMMVATAKAAALADSTQPKEVAPMLLVPSPQKNIAGIDKMYRAMVFLRVADRALKSPEAQCNLSEERSYSQ